MTKIERNTIQESINTEVERKFDEAINEYNTKGMCLCDAKRLHYCSAEVIETVNFYILRSYRTKIAAIDKRTDTCYDALRLVYGFTRTSAQHVAKFRHDYGAGKWGCECEKTWRYLE